MTGNGSGTSRPSSTTDLQGDVARETELRSDSSGIEGRDETSGEPNPIQPETPQARSNPTPVEHHRPAHLRIALPPRRSRLSAEITSERRSSSFDIPLQDRPSARNAPRSPLAGPSTPTVEEDENEDDNGATLKIPSPATPRTRARGYSLRTQLFVKNAVGTPTKTHRRGGSISSMISRHLPSRGGSDHSSEGKDPIVTYGDDSSTTGKASSKRKGFVGSCVGVFHPITNPISRGVANTINTIKKRISKMNEIPPTKNGRVIPFCPHATDILLDERTGHHYVNNTVRSSRYTVWNFLPKQIIFQFSKLANL